MTLPDPELLANITLAALKSPDRPAMREIVLDVANQLEGIVVEREEMRKVCAVWCVGACPCTRPRDWPTCYYDGCGRAVLRREGTWCRTHDRERDPYAGRRWVCACGWWGLDHEMNENPSGDRVCPDCGASGGLELATPRTYNNDPSRGLSSLPEIVPEGPAQEEAPGTQEQ